MVSNLAPTTLGHRTARMTRVYDKSFEALKNRGEVYPLPVTRYEVTARKDSGVTLGTLLSLLLSSGISPLQRSYHPNQRASLCDHTVGTFGWEHTPRTYTAHEVLERRISQR